MCTAYKNVRVTSWEPILRDWLSDLIKILCITAVIKKDNFVYQCKVNRYTMEVLLCFFKDCVCLFLAPFFVCSIFPHLNLLLCC